MKLAYESRPKEIREGWLSGLVSVSQVDSRFQERKHEER